MPLPSLQVLGIAANGDPSLFESLMAQAGFRVVPRDDDPMNTNVQEEAVAAVASAITEDAYHGVRLTAYHKQAKLLAERAGYVVMIENCGPPGADPCAGDLDGGMGGDEFGPEGGEEMGGEELPPALPEHDSEVEQVAALPIGTELAAEILAVLKGEGPAALDDMEDPDAGLHGEMPMGGEEFGGEEMMPVDEVGEGEALMAHGEGGEPKEEFGGEEEVPAEEETEGRPF